MAKPVMVVFSDHTISFAPTRVDRSKIYGARKRIPVDTAGRPCVRAALTSDGSQLLASGMTAQGYFTTDGRWVARSEMVGVDADGTLVDSKPSTLGVPQIAVGPVDPLEVLDLEVESVFFLEAEPTAGGGIDKLKGGEIYKVPFNYSAGLETEVAYLVANDEGVFALVGKPVVERWVDEGEAFTPPEVTEEPDDLDFEAL